MSKYRPEVVKTTTETVLAGVNKATSSKASGLAYRVKQNIFQANSFAVLSSTFTQNGGESEDFVEGIRRRIFEYGGKVVGEQHRANYVV